MEVTVEQKLRALYELQTIDTKIDVIRRMRGELPLEVKDLEDEIEGFETRQHKYEEEVGDLVNQINMKKAAIKDGNAAKTRYEAQLMNVKNSREYDAISKELEITGLDIQINEKKIREFTGQIEQKKIELSQVIEVLVGRRNDLEVKKGELDNIVSETEREESDLAVISHKAAEKIEERLFVAYKRIRDGSRNGQAVSTIERDACSGCFNKVPPQRQLDIRSRKKIIVCEHCGRILVDAMLAESVINSVNSHA